MPIDPSGHPRTPAQLEELAADPARQAVSTIRGYIYQFWWSVDAWLQLHSANEFIFLEGAEDLDKVRPDGATTEQIKNEAAGISLNNQRAHEALENFWTLSERETTRHVDYHYITTAAAATERDANFGDVCGMDAWRSAQTSLEVTAAIQAYLAPKLTDGSRLRQFLSDASPQEVQARLIRRFRWFLGQSGVEGVIESVEDRLVLLLSQKNIDLSYVTRAKDRLYSYVSQTILRPDSIRRRLTAADLLREIDSATTEHVAVPALLRNQFAAAMQAGAFDPGEALLRHMNLPLPPVPLPLLTRPDLVGQVRKLVGERKTVLLTGTVFKGKTTVAQLVANDVCPDAWWFPVSSRSGTETDGLLRALAAVVERESTPTLVVIDDVDLSPAAHAAYKQSLALVVSRANRAGRGLVLTARGATSAMARLADFSGIEAVDVPEMSTETVRAHCEANGCPERLAAAWGAMVRVATGGHPKLVQVRIAELSSSGWPAPLSAELLVQSPAIVNARQMARQLLSHSVTPKTAEVLYTAAEATFPLTRPMLLRVIEAVGDIPNGGDIIDSLLGKWLEQVMVERLRVTPILKGSGAEVWLPQRRRLAHRRLYDAIAGGRELDVADAAALLFHAFLAEDESRLMHCARVLESIDSSAISSAVFQHLLWVPHVALLPGQCFFNSHPYVSALLRQIQFSVANEIESDSLTAVLDRWRDEVEALSEVELREGMLVMLWSRVVSSRNTRIPLRSKLGAIDRLRVRTGSIADFARERVQVTIDMSRASPGGIPVGATAGQFFLSMQASAVRSLADFSSVLDWLDEDTSPETRADLEEVLGWPLVDSCGAFVHGAWSARHADETDWGPTLAVLSRADAISRRLGLVRFGSEVAKAASIINSEHLADQAAAVRILDDAAAVFGNTGTIQEQRVNVLFQAGNYEGALALWESLVADPEFSTGLDAFAFRRAGISACRLKRWADAEQYFLAGAGTEPNLRLEITRFGLIADASYVVALGGEPQRAARMLADMMLTLPQIGSEDGHESWEALFRLINSICDAIGTIAQGVTEPEQKVAFGRASEPGLSFGPAQGNQAVRVELAVAVVGLLAAKLGSVPIDYGKRLAAQQGSVFPAVRFYSSQARLALEFNSGTSDRFVSVLRTFERAFSSLRPHSDHSLGWKSDDGDIEPAELKTVDDGWFAVLSAAAICCDSPLLVLRSWRADAADRWGKQSHPVRDLDGLYRGLTMTTPQAWSVIRRSTAASRGEMLGAALLLVSAGGHRPTTMFTLQWVAVSATVSSSQGQMLQGAFGRAVARRLAFAWKPYLESPFLFTAPSRAMPLLSHAISDAEQGRASTKLLLEAVGQAVGGALGDIGARLE